MPSYDLGVSEIALEITSCRICKSAEIKTVIDFGELALTGVFLEDGNSVRNAPLVLVRCGDCGLVQLGHNYQQSELYGESYGYESHLNKSMKDHLQQKARILEQKFLQVYQNPIVVDIASNDGTLLAGYMDSGIKKVGIDPLIDVVSDCYPDSALKINDFFSSWVYWKNLEIPANLITSLSVIYDLDDPMNFAREVNEILIEGGIWHFEQSYLPTMIMTTSYDTICHEHLLYLSLHDIQTILSQSGFQILEVSLNSVNGGSIAVTAIKTSKPIKQDPFVAFLLNSEACEGITDGSSIVNFSKAYLKHSQELKELISEYRKLGCDVIGFGASTKGNVLLQAAGIDSSDIRAIGDVNSRKFGKETPGSCIPIVPEDELISNSHEKTVAIVLPWHFREGLIRKLEPFLSKGGKLVFPLPQIEVVSN